ncbi:MAG: phosphoglycolate phosphatase [Halobacteriota archaeon]
MISAAAFDIDGTLTFRDRSLELSVIGAIRRLRIPVILATGNVFCFVHAVAVAIGKVSGIIAENGGIVADNKARVISGNVEACRIAARAAERSGKFDLRRLDVAERVTEVAYSRDTLTDADVASFRKIVAECCPDVTVVDSGFALHIRDIHVNKGIGLTKIAELLGIPLNEFAAFGDSENDVEMLKVAGTGVAVGNADKKARAAADYVTKGDHGLGVIEGLKYLELL